MFKWLGRLVLLIGLVILISDARALLGEGEFRLTSLGDWWFWLHKDSLLLLQPAIERHVSQQLFDPWVLNLLEWPAAVEFVVLGLVFWGLSLVFRRRRN